MSRAHRIFAILAATGAFGVTSARAEEPRGDSMRDPVAAESAFADGRRLMAAGQYAEACRKLELSQKLDPALGTLMNLAECMKRTERNASAWLRYREAAALALRLEQVERERIAREQSAALEAGLCRVVVSGADARPDGLRVERDGAPIDPAALGIPVPLDPGPHTIAFSAPGRVRAEIRVDVPASPPEGGCATTTVPFPVLEREASRPPAPPAPGAGWRLHHTLAISALLTGATAAGVGAGFAFGAIAAQRDADGACTPSGCTPDGSARLHDAGRSADIATVLFSVGATAIVAGAVLWLTAPSLRARAASGDATVVHF